MNLAGVYTYNRSNHEYSEDDTEHNGVSVTRTCLDIQRTDLRIYDTGFKADFDYRPDTNNRLFWRELHLSYIQASDITADILLW